ncbi:very-short-patch-repair endonuclease [Pseudonocardia sediminis]|uniref:Very-short-patch-repair endonuclease n=1 Tax=Pseudonocardia sediminis TaxID=1397368 RepID=A0A4Q7V604_PSEST|nr:type IV toxin-antitoxin system AbiEi family antitoxin domain-containing protein [Pseudonocardia sediminis]RZT88934.1 very-short-patch-repair endonuclease [Pseudonocardia sediminis]
MSKLEDLLLRQNGVITREQAVRCGLSDRTVSRRVAAGAWRTLYPGVFLVGGHRLTDAARVRAASLWGGPEAVVSGPAAAFWLRMTERFDGSVDLTVHSTTRRRPRPGVRVRRRDLRPADRVMVNGLAVTEPGLTALEAAAVLPDGVAFLDRVLQQHHVRFEHLHEAYCGAVGAHGMARAGVLLRECADRADSRAERRLVRVLRRAGITGFVVGHPLGRMKIDIAFPDARLAIELDSWAWHTDHDRFEADREKGNALTDAGWNLLRITWKELTEHSDRVVARVRSALLRAA